MGIETIIAIGVAAAATAVSAQQSHAQTVEAKTAASHQEQAQRALQQSYLAQQTADQQQQSDLMVQARNRQRALAAASLSESRGGTILTSPQGVAPVGPAQPFQGTKTLLGT